MTEREGAFCSQDEFVIFVSKIMNYTSFPSRIRYKSCQRKRKREQKNIYIANLQPLCDNVQAFDLIYTLNLCSIKSRTIIELCNRFVVKTRVFSFERVHIVSHIVYY